MKANHAVNMTDFICFICVLILVHRYYFKVQAKNIFGLGPLSETLTYVTESGES